MREHGGETREGSVRGRRSRRWIALCAAALLVLLASRVVYYSPLPLQGGLAALLRGLLRIGTASTMVALIFFPILYVLGAGLGLLALVRRRWIFARDDGLWRLRDPVAALLWTLVVCGNGAYDGDPRVALVCAFTLPALHPVFRARLAALPPPWDVRSRRLFWAALLGSALALARDAADALVFALWLALAWALVHPAARVLATRERLLLALFVIPLLQNLGGFLLLVTPLHGGVRLGEGMAYSFCESPERERLYVTVPNCENVWIGLHRCLDGFVGEYDTRDLSLVARHHPLTQRFHGRMEQLLCLEDTVQIGMNRTLFDGERQLEDVLEFSMDDPSRVRTHLLGEEGGHRIHLDPRSDTLLYLGESVRKFFRYHRRTGVWERYENEGPASIQMTHADLHLGRGSLFSVGIGTPLHETDLDSLELVATRPAGGALELAVDEPLDRVYVTSFWGVEVHDLASGRVLFRRRVGMLGRRPVIDAERGLVYVATMGGGRLHVFDRQTFEPLGTLPLGRGSRYPHLLEDGSGLIAGSDAGFFHFDAEALSRRFRGKRGDAGPAVRRSGP